MLKVKTNKKKKNNVYLISLYEKDIRLYEKDIQ